MRTWRKSFLCGRKAQTVTIVLVIIVLFYWFQLASHTKINGWNRNRSKQAGFVHKHPKISVDVMDGENLDDQDDSNVRNSNRSPRGVFTADVDKYKIDGGVFHCLKSKVNVTVR